LQIIYNTSMDIVIRNIPDAGMPVLDSLYSRIVNEEFPEYSQRVRDYFSNGVYKQHMLSKPIRLGAYEGHTLVGFLLAEHPDGGIIFVYWLGVSVDHRGKGIGKQLLQEIEIIAKDKGAHGLQLQADEKNLPFYQHAGFEILGLDKKGYYGTDNYVLKKLIQEPQEDTWF